MSVSRRSSLRLLLPIALAASLAVTSLANAGQREDVRAHNAVRVLAEIQEIPESAIPNKLLDEARAIVVVPDTVKAGLVIGGRRGHGLIAVKSPDGTWSQPAFVTLTGGSMGLQAGVQSADIVMVFRNDRSLDSIVNGKLTLGADAGVAAGPLGRNASTATDGQLKAEIWSWSRARGLFAGIALDGAVLSIDTAWALHIPEDREETLTLCGTGAGAELFPGGYAVSGAEAATILANTVAWVCCTRDSSLSENISRAIFISLPIIPTTVSMQIDGSGFCGSSLRSVAIDRHPSLWRADRVEHPQLFIIS